MMKRTILLLISVVLIHTEALAMNAPTGLLCELLLRWPEKAVITDAEPEFSWVVPTGHTQQAYHILVASSPDKLETGQADLWDSGKVESAQSINVPFKGAALKPESPYWWKVRIWADNW